MDINIYTDGSSIRNGSPTCVAGWSCVFFVGNKLYVRYGHLPAPSSNNRGEIAGVLFAVNLLKDKRDWNIKIHSDSQYVVKGINEWRHKWAKTAYNDVKNTDLLIPLFTLWDEHGSMEIKWVRGHNGDPGNEIADEWAGKGSKNNIVPDVTGNLQDIRFVDYESLLKTTKLKQTANPFMEN